MSTDIIDDEMKALQLAGRVDSMGHFYGTFPARSYISDLLARHITGAPDKVLRCAFCGEPYPDGTPTHKHEALAAHIRVCHMHPVGRENREMRDLLKRLGRWDKKYPSGVVLPHNQQKPSENELKAICAKAARLVPVTGPIET